MKRSIFILSAGIVLLASCKEIGPRIGSSNVIDSTYTVSAPQADPHQVLVEEFTGESCSNCPAAEVVLGGELSSNPGRLNVVGYYIFNVPQADPPIPGVNDFRDSAATMIASTIYNGVAELPSAGIDRVPLGSEGLLQSSSSWVSSIDTRKSMPDSLNLSIRSVYTSIADTIVAYVTYVRPMSTQQKLTIVVVEDSITGVQEYPPHAVGGPYLSGFDSSYLYNNVCRDIVTAVPYGDPILSNITKKAPGRVLQATYIYTPKSTTWVPQHCRLVAFVTNIDGTVLQSAQTKLTGN